MEKIILSAPINSLSFGNVSYNFIREFYKLGTRLHFFPIGKSLDFSAFDKMDGDLKDYINESYSSRLDGLHKDIPSLKMWHINGSEASITPNRFLYTFHEISSATKTESTLCNLNNATFFSSSYSKSIFEKSVDHCYNIPIGFDTDFHKTGKTYLKNKIHFGLMGKFENRKHTKNIIKYWSERFGNNQDYQLSCCINNPFFKEEQNHGLILDAMGNKKFTNINILPRLSTNSEVNDFMNSIDIDLSGLSGAEGWNLPAFNSTCLGKWSIVLNSTSHKDWAKPENCILVEPSGTTDCYDDIFFKKDQLYNQGKIFTFDQDSFNLAVDKALKLIGETNLEGEKLKEELTYEKTIKQLTQIINK